MFVQKHSAPYFWMSYKIGKEKHVCKADMKIPGKMQDGANTNLCDTYM